MVAALSTRPRAYPLPSIPSTQCTAICAVSNWFATVEWESRVYGVVAHKTNYNRLGNTRAHRNMALSGESWPNPQFRATHGRGLIFTNRMNDLYEEHVLYNVALVPFFTREFWESSARQFGPRALRIPHLIKSTRQMGRPQPRAQICQNQYVDLTMRSAFQQDVNLLQVRRDIWAKLRPWYQPQIVEWEGSIYGCVSFIQNLTNLKVYYQQRDEAGVQEIVRKNVRTLVSPCLDTEPIQFYVSAVYYLFFAALPVRRDPETTSQQMFAQRTEWGTSQAVRDASDDNRAPYASQHPFQDPYNPDGGFGRTTDTTLLPRHVVPLSPYDRKGFLEMLGNMYALQESRYAATWPLALSQLFWAQHALLIQEAARMASQADGDLWLPNLTFQLPAWPMGARGPLVGLGGGPGGGGPGGGGPGGGGPGGGPRGGGNGGQGRGGGRGRGQDRGGLGRGRGWSRGREGGRGRGGNGRTNISQPHSRGHILQGGPSNAFQTVLPILPPPPPSPASSTTGGGRSASGADRVDQMRSKSWRGGGGSRRGGQRGFRAAKATIATSRTTSIPAGETYELPLPFLSIAEVGDHRREDDFWVLGDDGTSGYDVYDATSEYRPANFCMPWQDLWG